MNRLSLLIIMLLSSALTKAQVAVSYFPFQSIFSLSTNPDRLLWADYKLETNSFANNLTMELGPKINFIRRERVNYYCGTGLSFNMGYAGSDLPLVNGYFLDFGTKIIPIKDIRNLQLIFELSPYINETLKGGSMRSRLGFGWNFSHKPQSS